MRNKQNKYIFSRIAVIALCAVLLLSLVSCYAPNGNGGIGGANGPSENDGFEQLELIDRIFKQNSLFDIDEEALMTAVLKGYVDGTGDKYAEYFTPEEYKKLTEENSGEMVGVGISVVQNLEKNCIEIVNVENGSPALEAGVLPGDLIVYIGRGEDRKSVAETGYTMSLDLLAGEEGSLAEFTVLRGDEEIEFSIVRKKIVSSSVSSHIYTLADGVKIGIVRLLKFDLTTPTQFEEAVEKLILGGCENFVFDVRYNPGGDLRSITAVLAYFLNEGDVVIRVSDKSGNMTSSKIEAVKYTGAYAGCSIDKDDIGKYRQLNSAVLTNGSTASAAELFSAVLKDYNISFTVGTTTYGKGTMQTTIPLSKYGYEGAIKLTTKYYYSPLSESYEGKGIIPNIEVELDESLKGVNRFLIKDEEDNQLGAAVEELLKRASGN